jgi:hypothetical protein
MQRDANRAKRWGGAARRNGHGGNAENLFGRVGAGARSANFTVLGPLVFGPSGLRHKIDQDLSRFMSRCHCSKFGSEEWNLNARDFVVAVKAVTARDEFRQNI